MNLNKGISTPIAILIIIVCAVLVGGILVWQYWKTPQGEELSVKKEAKKAVNNFMKARLEEKPEVYSYLPNYAATLNVRTATVLTSFSEVILTTPRLGRYEIIREKRSQSDKSDFSVRSYITSNGQDVGYYDEKISIERVDGGYVLLSMHQSEYKPIVTRDECKDLPEGGPGGREYDQWDCYHDLAIERKDPSFCDKINYRDVSGGCYADLAQLTDDISLCEKANNMMDYCYKKFAEKERDEKYCDMMPGRGNIGAQAKSLCYYQVAVLKNDPELCDLASDVVVTPTLGREKVVNHHSGCKEYFNQTNGQVAGRQFIQIEQPSPGQKISALAKVKIWTANHDYNEKVYTKDIKVRIKNKEGEILGTKTVTDQPGNYWLHPLEVRIPFQSPLSGEGTIEVIRWRGEHVPGQTKMTLVPIMSEVSVVLPSTGEQLEASKELAEKVVRNYEQALKTRKRDKVLPYTTGELKKKIQGWPPIFGTSNPHPGGCEILSSKKISSNEFKVEARHFVEYTGEERISYNDNTYTVKKIGNRYLISSIEYGKQVKISD